MKGKDKSVFNRFFKVIIVFFIILLPSLGYKNISNCESKVNIYINGNPLVCDQNPIVLKSRVMVPFRAILENLGANVNYNEEKSMVIGELNNTRVEMIVNSKIMNVNGKIINMDIPPVVVNNRTLIPIRFISEAFGMEVKWDSNTNSVYVNYENNKEDIDIFKREIKEDDLQGFKGFYIIEDEIGNRYVGAFKKKDTSNGEKGEFEVINIETKFKVTGNYLYHLDNLTLESGNEDYFNNAYKISYESLNGENILFLKSQIDDKFIAMVKKDEEVFEKFK